MSTLCKTDTLKLQFNGNVQDFDKGTGTATDTSSLSCSGFNNAKVTVCLIMTWYREQLRRGQVWGETAEKERLEQRRRS